MTKPYVDICRAAKRERDRIIEEARDRQKAEAHLGDMYDPNPKPSVPRPVRQWDLDWPIWLWILGLGAVVAWALYAIIGHTV